MEPFRKYINQHPKEFLLASIAVIAQSVIFVATIFWGIGGFMWLADSKSYLAIAKNLIIHRGFFVNAEWGPEAFRTPLYPMFIAIFYRIIPAVWFVVFIQNIIAVASVLLTYKIGKVIFNPSAGFLGALFLIFESARLGLASQLMSETLFVFFVLSMVYFFVKFISENRKSYLIISAASAGLAALTRPIIQFLPFGMVLFLIIFGIVHKSVKRYISVAFLFLICCIITVSPWLIRNYIHFGKWELSSVGGENIHSYAAARFLEYKTEKETGEIKSYKNMLQAKMRKNLNIEWGPDTPDWTLVSTRLMEPEYEDYLTKEGLRIISTDIPLYIEMHLKRTVVFFMESSASRNYGALLYELRPHLPSKIFYPFLYFAGRTLRVTFDMTILLSFIFFFNEYRKRFWMYFFIAGTVVYFGLFSAIHTDIGRFRQPIDPLIFLFLANAIILFIQRLKNKKMHNMPEPISQQIGVGCCDFGGNEKKYVNEALDSCRLSYGPFSKKFEKTFAALHDCKHGIMVNSGTSALRIAVAALKEMNSWHDGDEIIAPSITFVASTNVIIDHGLKPVFVDVDARTYNLDPSKIEEAITGRTKAIMVVHLFGQPAEMDPIMEIAKKYNLKVIEDSCETMFVKYKGMPVGSFGDASCFSTYMAHILVTGVGGYLLTNDDNCAIISRSLANHGRDSIYLSIDDDKNLDDKGLSMVVSRRFKFERLGYSFRATEMEAAIGVAQLERWEEIIKKRQDNAMFFIDNLAQFGDSLQLPSWPDYKSHAFMMFPIVIKDETIKKSDLTMFLEKHNIETRDMMPLLNQPIYKKLYGNIEDNFPVAKWINDCGFYIGCHQLITETERQYVAGVFKEFFNKRASL